MNQEHETAKKVIGLLDQGLTKLDTKIIAKLASARSQAVTLLAGHAQSQPVTVGHHALMRQAVDYFHGHRGWMSAALVCGAILVVFVATQQLPSQQVVEQGDAFLLASELPPEAYLDKGFDAWLKHSSRH
jgi:hypothetical protein